MHISAMLIGERVFQHYAEAIAPGGVIVDVGAMDINGSLRSVCPSHLRYVGVDIEAGKGVDLVATDPYRVPLDDEVCDIVVSSSCFEHNEFFWLTFLDALRILKPGGVLYVNAPATGPYHKHPLDCWRFYPDAGLALTSWGRRNGYPLSLAESFIGPKSNGIWNDFAAVFVKADTPVLPARGPVCRTAEGVSHAHLHVGFGQERRRAQAG
jgi:SAM-dependent methyltransferase